MRAALLTLLLLLVAFSACSENRDQLLAELQSPRPEIRASALKRLAKNSGENELILFTTAAKDVAGMVRAEAATALGRSQDPRVVDLLGELLADPEERVQTAAAQALAEIDHPKARSYLTMQYARHGRSVRLAIIKALEAADVPHALREVVEAESRTVWDRNIDALESGGVMEQVAAAEAIGRSGRAEGVGRLAELARDRQVILAAAAVRGLAESQDPRVAPAIIPLLDAPSLTLREAASLAMARLRDPGAVKALQAVALQKDAAAPAAVEALLAYAPSPEVDAALCAIALDGVAREARRLARPLRARGCPLEPIEARLARPEGHESGLQAVRILGPRAQPLREQVLALIDVPEVRLTAIEAAGALGDPATGERLRAVVEAELKSLEAQREDWVKVAPEPTAEDRQAKQEALADNRFAQLMGKVREADAARAHGTEDALLPDELIADLEPERVHAAITALVALGQSRGEGAEDLIVPLTRDPHAELRSGARLALAHVGTPSALKLAAEEFRDGGLNGSIEVAEAMADAGEAGRETLLASLERAGGNRTALLEALALHPLPKNAAAALIPLLEISTGEAALAATLLGRHGDASAVEPLAKVLADPTTVGRRPLVWALGQLGDVEAAPSVAVELFHDSPEVRVVAAEAIGRMKATDYVPHLTALTKDYDVRVREAATAALAQLGGPRTAEGGTP